MSRYFALMTAVLSLGFLMACDPGPWDAPPFAEIDDIEDIQVPWTACRIDPLTGNTSTPGCENDPPVILPLNVLVRNARTQEPLNNVRIWYASGYHLIYLLPQEVLEAVDLPGTERWEYLEERGDVFAEFSGSFDGDYRPTYHEGWTNSNDTRKKSFPMWNKPAAWQSLCATLQPTPSWRDCGISARNSLRACFSSSSMVPSAIAPSNSLRSGRSRPTVTRAN